MGGAVSAGEDNDDLIDKLVDANYIKSPSVELFFRVIDRGFYFLPSHRSNAYRDQAWRLPESNLHLSAPCIYSEALEALDLKPGMSFLNVGSGTGYLSTLAGLLLGARGINHGIELHRNVVKYSQNKLQQFLGHSPALYLYDFTEPQFIVGNAITVLSEDSIRDHYDRVYCGAAVPSELESFMKSLLKIGGILVMPANDQLIRVTRKSADEFETESILPVNFAMLVLPCNRPSQASTPSRSPSDSASSAPDDDNDHVFYFRIPENQPKSLKLLCRSTIIRLVRTAAEREACDTDKSPIHIKTLAGESASSSSHPKDSTKPFFRRVISDQLSRGYPGATSSTDSEDGSPLDISQDRRQIIRRCLVRHVLDRRRAERRAAAANRLESPAVAESITSDHSISNGSDDMTGSSSSGDSGVSEESPVDCSDKRSISQADEDSGEAAAGPSSAPPDSGRGSGTVMNSLALPLSIAQLRQQTLEALRHRRKVRTRRIVVYSTDSEDSESQETADGANGSEESTSRGQRSLTVANENADPVNTSQEEQRRGEEAYTRYLLMAPLIFNPLIPVMQKKIQQLPLPPALQVYVNFCRPFTTD